MDTPLSELYGVGPVAKRVFDRAGLTKCGHVYSDGGQEEAVRTAARELAEIAGTAEAGHWRALATYCVTVIRRVRSLEAQPYVPEVFLCPIMYTCMEDPVITRHGVTFERHAIERVANDPDTENRIDPVARLPISANDLFPNRALKETIELHLNHFMRFSVPFRMR